MCFKRYILVPHILLSQLILLNLHSTNYFQQRKKGMFGTDKKEIILEESSLRIFIDDYYLPILENMHITFLMLFY